MQLNWTRTFDPTENRKTISRLNEQRAKFRCKYEGWRIPIVLLLIVWTMLLLCLVHLLTLRYFGACAGACLFHSFYGVLHVCKCRFFSFFFFLLLFSSWYVRQIALNFGIVCQCRWRHVFSGSEYNSMICCCCQRKMCALSLALSPCSIRSAAWLLMERTRILLPAYTSYLFRSETLSHFLFQNYCHVNKYNERGKH